ncbi:hypothetical protein L218DRAFT_942239 [Marasmius fiardii PR-910]|nr:hypothetical protein L218DRAFT_942239 [Marasmius fiardii PR-910]
MKTLNLLVGLLSVVLAAPARSENMAMTPGGIASQIQRHPDSRRRLNQSHLFTYLLAQCLGKHRHAACTNSGQTIFLFNGLMADSRTAILQPVLQWGLSHAGGSSYWGVANWNVSDTSAYWTALERVEVGNAFKASYVVLLKTQTARTTIRANVPDIVNLNNSPGLTTARETVEAYRVINATDYPKGCTSGIGTKASSWVAAVSWSTVNDDANGIRVMVITNGGNNEEVSICYPSQ